MLLNKEPNLSIYLSIYYMVSLLFFYKDEFGIQ